MDEAPALADPYLRNWFADVRSVTAGAKKLFAGLSPEQLTWKPSPKTWSVAECLSHLAVTAGLYHPRIESVLSELPVGDPSPAPFRARWLQGRFIAAIGPQSKRRFKASQAFRPSSSDLDPTRVGQEFFARQEELADLVRRSDGRDLNRGKVPTPLTKLLSFTLGEALWLLTAHGERHLRQARRLARLEDFPTGGSGASGLF